MSEATVKTHVAHALRNSTFATASRRSCSRTNTASSNPAKTRNARPRGGVASSTGGAGSLRRSPGRRSGCAVEPTKSCGHRPSLEPRATTRSKEAPMIQTSKTAAAGVGGIAFGGLTLAALLLTDAPGGSYSASDVASFLARGHRPVAIACFFLAMLGILGLISLLAHLRDALASAPEGHHAASIVWGAGLARCNIVCGRVERRPRSGGRTHGGRERPRRHHARADLSDLHARGRDDLRSRLGAARLCADRAGAELACHLPGLGALADAGLRRGRCRGTRILHLLPAAALAPRHRRLARRCAGGRATRAGVVVQPTL